MGLGAACGACAAPEEAGVAVPCRCPGRRGGEPGGKPRGGAAGASEAGADGEGALADVDVALGFPGEVQPAAARTAAARSTIPRDFERPLYHGMFSFESCFYLGVRLEVQDQGRTFGSTGFPREEPHVVGSCALHREVDVTCERCRDCGRVE